MLYDIEFDGKHAVAVFLDEDFQPVSPEEATLAKVIFDDGGNQFVAPEEVRNLLEEAGSYRSGIA